MTQVFDVDPRHPEGSGVAVRAAAEALRVGSLVILPTETVYGIACRPDLQSATARLFAAKRRPPDLNLPVLAESADAAWELGVPDARAVRLAAAFWPGPLTMVVRRSARSGPWQLGARTDSIALRVPALPLTTAVLEAAGALAATSANLSGRPPLSDRNELVAGFGEAVAVYLVAGPGDTPTGESASTVVDLRSATLQILRHGPIGEDRIRTAAR